jgi:hypothetical protein
VGWMSEWKQHDKMFVWNLKGIAGASQSGRSRIAVPIPVAIVLGRDRGGRFRACKKSVRRPMQFSRCSN